MDTLLSCIIIDDEPLAVRLLESFVIKTPDLKLLGSYTDSVEAINAVREQKPSTPSGNSGLSCSSSTSRCPTSTGWNWPTCCPKVRK